MNERGPEKPAFGLPCNGCGFCCAAEVCAIGLKVFGRVPAPCPALTWREGRFWCGVVDAADNTGPTTSLIMRAQLAIGRGCDSDDGEAEP